MQVIERIVHKYRRKMLHFYLKLWFCNSLPLSIFMTIDSFFVFFYIFRFVDRRILFDFQSLFLNQGDLHFFHIKKNTILWLRTVGAVHNFAFSRQFNTLLLCPRIFIFIFSSNIHGHLHLMWWICFQFMKIHIINYNIIIIVAFGKQ